MSAVRTELHELWDEVSRLPHARYCPAGADPAFRCGCGLGDALDLILGRIDTLPRRGRLDVLHAPLHPLRDDGPVARAAGWGLSRVVDLIILPVAVWDDLHMAMDDHPTGGGTP